MEGLVRAGPKAVEDSITLPSGNELSNELSRRELSSALSKLPNDQLFSGKDIIQRTAAVELVEAVIWHDAGKIKNVNGFQPRLDSDLAMVRSCSMGISAARIHITSFSR